MVGVGDVRVMRGFFVSAGVVMFRRLLVMTCRVFVMLRRFPVMLCRFLRHQGLLVVGKTGRNGRKAAPPFWLS
jgi:hypothetical protein